MNLRRDWMKITPVGVASLAAGGVMLWAGTSAWHYQTQKDLDSGARSERAVMAIADHCRVKSHQRVDEYPNPISYADCVGSTDQQKLALNIASMTSLAVPALGFLFIGGCIGSCRLANRSYREIEQRLKDEANYYRL